MSNPTTSDSSKRLAVLERRMKLMEQALTAEQKKTAEMQKVIAVYANDLEQTLDIYDKAFGQAAKSYEPIIQRALILSKPTVAGGEKPSSRPVVVDKRGKVLKAGEPGEEQSFMDNVVAIMDDLPKALAAVALIISLFTGGTSIVSLVQSNFAHNQAAEAKAEAGTAKVDAVEAKKDAETARQGAGVALETAGTAQTDAAQAKSDAETAKESSATAVQQSSDAQVEAAAAKQEAETTAQIVDKLADSVMSDQGGP
ncbi:MAG TPA: hypothetical protein G4N96_07665 [Chloroflexi bacterium]|nr:hypothetical protein [Chloroflexota bacterium]